MKYMSVNLLLDTNILVYAYDTAVESKRRPALEILDTCAKNRQAVISSQVLGEFAFVVSRKLEYPIKGEQLMLTVDRLAKSFPVLPVNAFIVREAVRGMEQYRMSFWDAQIWATARLNQIGKILTEDVPGQAYIEGVRYINPFED